MVVCRHVRPRTNTQGSTVPPDWYCERSSLRVTWSTLRLRIKQKFSTWSCFWLLSVANSRVSVPHVCEILLWGRVSLSVSSTVKKTRCVKHRENSFLQNSDLNMETKNLYLEQWTYVVCSNKINKDAKLTATQSSKAVTNQMTTIFCHFWIWFCFD